jgi:hypothetical protein
MEFIYFLLIWGVIIIAAGVWGYFTSKKLERDHGSIPSDSSFH